MRRAIIAACFALSACGGSGYTQFYKAEVDARTMPDVQLLGKGETPRIFASTDLRRDVKIATSKGYRSIGYSSFNGQMESERKLVKQAAAVGAVMVLVNSSFTGTRSITVPLFIPNDTTTQSSGRVSSAYGTATYSGTSTTSQTAIVPLTTQQDRYDQAAVYFVKSTKKSKFGVFLVDVPPELRSRYQRNTGAVVDIVEEDSPAFIANVLADDLITEVNGIPVTSARHAVDVMRSAVPTNGTSSLRIIRNGEEKTIQVHIR